MGLPELRRACIPPCSWNHPLRLRLAFLLVGVALIFPTVAESSDSDTLRGVLAVSVRVDLIQPSSLRPIIRSQILERVQRDLRKNGIEVVSDRPLGPSDLQLLVTLSAVESPSSNLVYCSLSVEGLQLVHLQRNPQLIRPAVTWSAHKLLLYRSQDAAGGLTLALDALVENFARDYHRVNPEEPP